MNAEANGHSSTAVRTSSRAALRISLIPDPRSSPGNSPAGSGRPCALTEGSQRAQRC